MNLQVRHWRRYGQDRTYFSTLGGQPLGWQDNSTGRLHTEDAEAELLIKAWLRERDRGSDPARARQLDRPPSLSHSPAPISGEDDLALRSAGAASRQRADSEGQRLAARWRFLPLLARLLDAKTSERSWRVGAAGEARIGGLLEKLEPEGWRVLHSIPVGSRGSDIDHLLVGPGGVWTINTKFHPGKRVWVSRHQIRVNNHPVPYLRNSEFEANRARDLLSKALGFEVHVRGALVFMTGTWIPNVRIVGSPDNVDVMHRADVRRRFRRMPSHLTPQEIDAIFDVARRAQTWQ